MIVNEQIEDKYGYRILGLKYKTIISKCTSGNIIREDLISNWCRVKLSDNSEVEAYHHKLHAWMMRGIDKERKFTHGYCPVKEEVKFWAQI